MRGKSQHSAPLRFLYGRRGIRGTYKCQNTALQNCTPIAARDKVAFSDCLCWFHDDLFRLYASLGRQGAFMLTAFLGDARQCRKWGFITPAAILLEFAGFRPRQITKRLDKLLRRTEMRVNKCFDADMIRLWRDWRGRR